MVEVLDPVEGEVICDPCCGSGGFLIKAFEYVRSKIEFDIKNKKEEISKFILGEDFPITRKSQMKIELKLTPILRR